MARSTRLLRPSSRLGPNAFRRPPPARHRTPTTPLLRPTFLGPAWAYPLCSLSGSTPRCAELAGRRVALGTASHVSLPDHLRASERASAVTPTAPNLSHRFARPSDRTAASAEAGARGSLRHVRARTSVPRLCGALAPRLVLHCPQHGPWCRGGGVPGRMGRHVGRGAPVGVCRVRHPDCRRVHPDPETGSRPRGEDGTRIRFTP
jgi:hypothetical protein